MSLISFTHDQNSVLLRIKILNSAVSTGAGKTGIAFNTSGLVIATIADNEATTTSYTEFGGTIETISALGTYGGPTASKCGFKEVDATSHKGVYEIQLLDARFGIASAKSLLISVSGASGAAEADVLIPLTQTDPYDNVQGGITALPAAAADAAGGLATSLGGSTGIDDLATPTNITAGTITTVATTTNVTNDVGITQAGADKAWSTTTRVLTAGTNLNDITALDVWDVLTSNIVTSSTIGILLKTNIDAVLSNIEADTDDIQTQIGTAGAGLNDLGGMSTGMKGEVNAEMDGALDTAIPVSPTADSINQRLKAVDVLTEASGTGDLAAMLVDTNTTIPGLINGLDDITAIEVWDVLTSAIVTSSTIGVQLKTNIDVVLSSIETDIAAVQTDTTAILTKLPFRPTKNVAFANFTFLMVNSTDHVTAEAGIATVNPTRSIDGGSFSATDNAVTEISDGWYKVNLSADDLNGEIISLKFTGTSADARNIQIITQTS